MVVSLFLEICNRSLHLTVSLSLSLPPPPPRHPHPLKKVTIRKQKKEKKKKIKAEISGGKKDILKGMKDRKKKKKYRKKLGRRGEGEQRGKNKQNHDRTTLTSRPIFSNTTPNASLKCLVLRLSILFQAAAAVATVATASQEVSIYIYILYQVAPFYSVMHRTM